MKDFLTDIVHHTLGTGKIDVIKITGDDKETKIQSVSEDRTLIINATFNAVNAEFEGVFGMPNLNKLDIHLKCPEYKENYTINVVKQERNGEVIPTGLHFQNGAGDFENDYRFMNSDIINEKLKSVKYKGAKWDIEFVPAMASIQKLKFQASAHTEELTFQVKTEDSNLVFSFGDASTHAGSFVFQANVEGKLRQTWAWPVTQVQSILNLNGDKTIRIADAGALQITVDSGIAEYEYILPAQSK